MNVSIFVPLSWVFFLPVSKSKVELNSNLKGPEFPVWINILPNIMTSCNSNCLWTEKYKRKISSCFARITRNCATIITSQNCPSHFRRRVAAQNLCPSPFRDSTAFRETRLECSTVTLKVDGYTQPAPTLPSEWQSSIPEARPEWSTVALMEGGYACTPPNWPGTCSPSILFVNHVMRFKMTPLCLRPRLSSLKPTQLKWKHVFIWAAWALLQFYTSLSMARHY